MVFTVKDLRGVLEPFSLTRRKALLFCLDNHTRPEQLLSLCWNEVFKRPLEPFAREIARSMPRHVRLPYVFWEYVEGQGGLAAPLFNLECELVETTGYSYEQLKELYDGMLWIDPDADAEVFMSHLRSACELRGGMRHFT